MTAEQYNLPFFLEQGDVKKYSEDNKLSVEEAGRILRYKALDAIAVREGFNKIATAHNSNDNEETILLNLFKGAGLHGITGIPVIRGNIIRPMLCLSKAEVLEYLSFYNIKYITDSSNEGCDFMRNKLRNIIIPLIRKEINPSLDKALLNFALINSDINRYILADITKLAESVVSFGSNVLYLNKSELQKVTPSLTTALVKFALDKHFKCDFSYSDYLSVYRLIDKKAGKIAEISNNFTAINDRQNIIVFKNSNEWDFPEQSITLGTKIDVFGKTLEIIPVDKEEVKFLKDKKIEYISGDNINSIFTVRLWKSGDYFYPAGLNKKKLLSDFFTDIKLSAFEKKIQTVVENNGRIVWVTGQRIDDSVKIDNNTKKVVKLCLQ
jgi:tRNA(Ile)-lysidine synthase